MTWFFAVLALLLAAILAIQFRQRQRLRQWLRNPEQADLPDGLGAWRDIFLSLHRWRKEEHRGQQALQSELERFRQATQALPDGVVLLDADGRIEWLNETACRQFSLDPRRDLGTLIEQLLRNGGFIEYLRNFRAGHQGVPLLLPMNGEPPLPCVLSIMLLSFGESGTLLLSHDISDIARTDNMRRDFIANVSHELRTPLTVISGFLEQMIEPDGPKGDAARGFLVLMHEQALRMNRLVEDLLTLSRLENTTEPPRDEPVDVPSLLHALLAEAQALSAGRHQIVLVETAAAGLRGSSDELRSAFGNLISNAVRYTPTGGRIEVRWRVDTAGGEFSVSDNGMGIPAEHIPRLTERFYRVDKGRSAATGGTGLGLAIVKHVLARHQGTLAIASEVGRGSTFSIRLPAERLDQS